MCTCPILTELHLEILSKIHVMTGKLQQFLTFLCINHISDKIFRLLLAVTLRERLRTHKVLTKDQCFYLNYHKFSIKSYVLDVY